MVHVPLYNAVTFKLSQLRSYYLFRRLRDTTLELAVAKGSTLEFVKNERFPFT